MPSRSLLPRLLMLAGSLVFALLVGELAVRLLGVSDADGNFFLDGVRVKPFRLPVRVTQAKLDEYLAAPTPRLMPDPDLGWTPRPGGVSRSGRYKYNSHGLRSAPTEYTLEPREGLLRIALFGDSFTHASDVSFEEGWSQRLEAGLNQASVTAEVLNFGVSAYGMDQAYLRWTKLGHRFSPDIVIFGLQLENVRRNVNLLRPLYDVTAHDSFPFSKPRFILTPGGLELINVPVVPPEELPDLFTAIEGWPLLQHERFYRPQDYRASWWRRSKLVSRAVKALDELSSPSGPDPFFDLEGEAARVALAIVEAFARDVAGRGPRFLVVHLPLERDLEDRLRGREYAYAGLLGRVDSAHELIRVEAGLLEYAREHSLAALFRGHYTAQGNAIVGDAVAEYLLRSLEVSGLPARLQPGGQARR